MIERITWADFIANEFVWEQGEHITIIGVNGSSKTTLSLNLIRLGYRKNILFLASKPKDDLIDNTIKQWKGWDLLRTWNPDILNYEDKLILEPRSDNPILFTRVQKQIFSDALVYLFAKGGFCIVWDELHYFSKFLGMNSLIEVYAEQGRSIGLTSIFATQRPRNVPIAAFANSIHYFFARIDDDDDRKRVKEIGGLPIRELFEAMETMTFKGEWVYYSKKSRKSFIIDHLPYWVW